MARKYPDGSLFGFSTALTAALSFTAITNDATPSITTAGTIANGDILILQSGWPLLNNRVVVAGDTTSMATAINGVDTTDTTDFPVGKGIGSVITASSFVDFSQQGNLSMSGGEPKTYTGTYLEDPLGIEFQDPIGQTSRVLSLPVDVDPTLPWYEPALKVTRKRTAQVIRIALPNGDVKYEYGRIHFSPMTKMEAGAPQQGTVTFYLAGLEGTLIKAA